MKEITLPDRTKATSNYSVFNKPSFEKIFDSSGKEREGRIAYRNEKGANARSNGCNLSQALLFASKAGALLRFKQVGIPK